jgi:pseudouridine-5'-phosphate glycosidase
VTDHLVLSGAVEEAVQAGRPVVALETSVIAQGLPRPWNERAAEAMARAIHDGGAEPAWIWVDEGAVRVGASAEALARLAERTAVKVARRDFPIAMASGGLGATTVSATLWAAHAAGIEVMATGGIGGVHRGTGDVSADLHELGRTPGTVVCAGPKTIVDPVATMERLEELGVGVVGYRCERLPFFFVREADLPLEHRADDPEAVARMSLARRALGVESALLVCNPIPQEAALDPVEMGQLVDECAAEAVRQRVFGKSVTPFLLGCLAEKTDSRTIGANLALLESNAALAAQVAAAFTYHSTVAPES